MRRYELFHKDQDLGWDSLGVREGTPAEFMELIRFLREDQPSLVLKWKIRA